MTYDQNENDENEKEDRKKKKKKIGRCEDMGMVSTTTLFTASFLRFK